MATNQKQKQIQIQKPAQSLEAFKAKAAAGDTGHEGLLKPLAIGGGVVVAIIVAISAISNWRSSRIEKHEAAVAELVLEMQAAPGQTSTPAELEKKMRERLPRLEALAKSAPSSRKADAEALVATWKLALDGKGGTPGQVDDPWSRLRLAQRQIALAQGKEAAATLEPLRKNAEPGQAWGHLYWSTQIEVDRLLGNREQAWKDLAEYKQRYKEQAEAASLERVIASI